MEVDARPGGVRESSSAGSRRPVALLRLLSWVAALGVWAAFVLFCVGLTFSRGLCCADDSWFAVAAKNIATGVGYLKPLDDSMGVPYSTRFNPPFGMGPTLIVPCAAIMRVVGVNEVVPGLSAILLWASLLTALFVRMGRQTTNPGFPLAVAIFCFACLIVFAAHFEQLYAFLGEIPVAAFSLLALWIVAVEKLSGKSLFLSGILIGLSLQTKPIAALTVPAFLVVLALRLKGAGLTRRALFGRAALASAACFLPTAAFETIKLQRLGLRNYADYTWHFLGRLVSQGAQWGFLRTLAGHDVGAEHASVLELLRQRIEVIHDHFVIHPVFLLAFLVLPLVLWRGLLEERWRPLFLGLFVAIWSFGGYWLFISIGWPRYLVVAVAIGCFALCIPIVGLQRAWQRVLFALVSLAVLIGGGGLGRLRFIVTDVDNGLFRPSSERLARARVVATIKEQAKQGPLILSSEGWASYVDVEFLLDGPMNFRSYDRISSQPGRKAVLMNRRFRGTNADVTREVRSRTSATLFSEGLYELLEIR
jgi:hypothetical protein